MSSFRMLVAAAAMFLLSGVPAIARADWSTDSTANSPITSAAVVPQRTDLAEPSSFACTSDSAGGLLVAWCDVHTGTSRIFVQRLDPVGRQLWGANGRAVSPATSGGQYDVQVVADGIGGGYVAWSDARDSVAIPGRDRDVYLQRFDASGNARWSSGGLGICRVVGMQYELSMDSDRGGGVLLSWTDERYGVAHSSIFAQRVLPSAIELWTSQGSDGYPVASGQVLPYGRNHSQISGYVVSPTFASCIYGNGPGAAIVVWNDDRDHLANSVIYGQSMNHTTGTSEAGSTWGVPIAGMSVGLGPRLVGDLHGGAIVAWHSGPDAQLKAIRWKGVCNGVQTPWGGAAIDVSPDPGNAQVWHRLLTDEQGGAFIVWQGGSGSPDGIYAQHLAHAKGERWSSRVRVDVGAAVPGRMPALASDGDGGVFVTWMVPSATQPRGFDLYARRVDAAGELLGSGPVAVCAASGDQREPEVLADGRGGHIVVWSDGRSGGDDLFAQRLGGTDVPGPPPVIDAFSPTSGITAGTVLDLYGSGFSASASVTLGAVVLSPVTLVSSDHVQVSVPTGASSGALVVRTLMGDARAAAPVLVSTPGQYAGMFFGGPNAVLGVPGNARKVHLGDLDNDGRLDAVVSSDAGLLNIYPGRGDGSFDPPFSLPFFGKDRQNFAIGDLDGDGWQDLAACNVESAFDATAGDTMFVYFNAGNGSGTFIEPPLKLFCGRACGIAVGDLYGHHDGRRDIVVGYASSSASGLTPQISIYRNSDADHRQFQPRVTLPDKGLVEKLLAVDLDADGDSEIVVVNTSDLYESGEGAASFQVYRNDGAGNFEQSAYCVVGFQADSLNDVECVAAGDLDGDGLVDLSFTGLMKPAVVTYLNQGGCSFSNSHRTFTRFGVAGPVAGNYSVSCHDMNADGLLDLVVPSCVMSGLQVLIGDGTGHFSPAVGAPEPSLAFSETHEIGDLNHDGRPDVVSANRAGTGSLTVMLGKPLDDLTIPVWPSAPVGGPVRALVASEWTGDSRTDVAVLTGDGTNAFPPESLVVLSASGDRALAPVTRVALAPGSLALASADMDSDGDDDLVSCGASGLTVLLQGAGASMIRTDYATNANGPLVTGFFDPDSNRDVVAVDLAQPKLALFLGGAGGGLDPQTDIALPGIPLSLAVGDMSGDGRPDLVIGLVQSGQGKVGVLRNLGGATPAFLLYSLCRVPGLPASLAIGRMTADTLLDVVVGYSDSSIVTVLSGGGDGSLTPFDSLQTGSGPTGSLALADFDDDGWPDVALPAPIPGQIAYALNDRTGRLFSPHRYGGMPFSIGSLAVADLNGDGKPDVAAAAPGLQAVVGYFNRAVFAPGNWQAGGTALGGTRASISQRNPQTTTDGAGGQYITWAERPLGGSNYDVMLQHLAATGGVAPGWPPGGFSVCNAPGDQIPDRLVPDSSTVGNLAQVKGAIAVWTDSRDMLSRSTDIYTQRVTERTTGLGPQSSWTSNGVPIVADAGVQDLADAASDGSRGVFVSWRDSTAATLNSVFSQRLDSRGVPQVGDPASYGRTGTRWATSLTANPRPRVVTPRAGQAHVAWSHRPSEHPWLSVSSGPNTEIWVGCMDTTGTELWRTRVAGSVIATREGVRITPDGSGGSLAAWCDRRGPDADIYMQRLDAAGVATWSLDGVPVSVAAGDQVDVELGSSMASGTYLAWTDEGVPDSRIVAQRVDGSGTPQWALGGVAVAGSATGAQSHAAVTTDSDGGLIALYEQAGAGGQHDIHASRLRLDGTLASGWPGTGRVVANGAGTEDSPRIVGDFASGAIASWHSLEPSSETVRAARLTGTGAVQGGTADTPVMLPQRLSLGRPRPNPSHGAVRFELWMPSRADARVEVLDVQGRRIAVLMNERQAEPGMHELRWDAPAAPGLYFVHARSASVEDVRRVVLLR